MKPKLLEIGYSVNGGPRNGRGYRWSDLEVNSAQVESGIDFVLERLKEDILKALAKEES